jgi:putative peptide zinc metalloprotease protein
MLSFSNIPFYYLNKVMGMVFTNEAHVTLKQLVIRKDQKHYIVEDVMNGEFYEMPEVCIVAIELLNQRKSLKDVEKELTVRYPDEDIDLSDFVSQLLELDLVSEINGEKMLKSLVQKEQSGYSWISINLGRFFFNYFSSNLYVVLLIASIGLIVFNPALFPSYTDLFAFDLMLQNMVAWLVITLVLVLFHEFGHVLAVRSEGLPAKIGIGHRLFLVVLETDMSQVWKLPPQKRNRLYLAGMYFDSVLLFLALISQNFTNESSLMGGLLKLVVLDTFIRLVYQTAVFMKTDLYYFIENKTGCYNLMENGRNFLAQWLPFLRVPETETFEGEEKVVRRYAVFYLAGILLTLAITAFYYIPQLIFAVNQIMLPGFSEPISSMRFWDSVVFLLQIVLVIGLLLYSWTKKYRYSS